MQYKILKTNPSVKMKEELLLKYSANPNTQMCESPLLMGIMQQNKNIVKLLMDYEVELNKYN